MTDDSDVADETSKLRKTRATSGFFSFRALTSPSARLVKSSSTVEPPRNQKELGNGHMPLAFLLKADKLADHWPKQATSNK